MELADLLRHIQRFPGSRVDRNFGLGHAAVEKQLGLLAEAPVSQSLVDQVMTHSKHMLAEMEALVRPYELPAVYREFLATIGGFSIGDPFNGVSLDVFGLGPGTATWYADVVDVNRDSDYIPRWIMIARWEWNAQPLDEGLPEVVLDDARIITPFDMDYPGPPRMRRERFFLDVGAVRHRGGVFWQPPQDTNKVESQYVQVAGSFADWLGTIASTDGQLDQLVPPAA